MITKDKFPGQITQLRNRDIAMPRLIKINLATAESEREFNIAGNLFYVWNAPDESSYITIKVNGTDQPGIDFVRMTGLETPFERLYITTPAGQTGILYLLYGTEAPDLMRLIDNRSASIAGLSAIRDELRGDTSGGTYSLKTVSLVVVTAAAANSDRKGASLSADPANTDYIYIGFDNTVTRNNYAICLMPGQIFVFDDYRGPLYAISGTINQLLGVGEW